MNNISTTDHVLKLLNVIIEIKYLLNQNCGHCKGHSIKKKNNKKEAFPFVSSFEILIYVALITLFLAIKHLQAFKMLQLLNASDCPEFLK